VELCGSRLTLLAADREGSSTVPVEALGKRPPSGRDPLGEPAEDAELAELYRTESASLARVLTRRTGNPDEAHDLVQDVFFRLSRLGAKRALLERPQAYLRRIASNLLKDRAKAAARRSAALHLVAEDDALRALDQQSLLESRDMLNRIEAAMMRLRPRTREIFMAHRIDGFSYAEIAQRTGLSVKGVEKQMSKALVQLDRLLDRG